MDLADLVKSERCRLAELERLLRSHRESTARSRYAGVSDADLIALLRKTRDALLLRDTECEQALQERDALREELSDLSDEIADRVCEMPTPSDVEESPG